MKKRRISANEVMESRYYQLPKFIVHEKEFKGLSLAAKVLYSIMRDRHELSLKNGWVDKEGNVFMYYSRQNMMEDLQIADKTVTKAVKELIKYELIDEVRQGLNKPNIIYVMTVDIDSQWTRNIYESGNVEFTSHGVVNITSQEPKNLRPNDTEIKETEIKETKKDNMSDFMKVWSKYPRKEGRDTAEKKMPLLIKEYGLDQMIRATERYANKVKTENTEKKFIKLGSTFYNGGYKDYLDENFLEQPKVEVTEVGQTEDKYNGFKDWA